MPINNHSRSSKLSTDDSGIVTFLQMVFKDLGKTQVDN